MLEEAAFPWPELAWLAATPAAPVVGIAAYRGQAAGLAAALGLPVTPRRVSVGGIAYMWAGPGRLFASGPGVDVARFAANFEQAAFTDQSDGRVVLAFTPPGAAVRLALLVPIDLHESVFGPDATALTLAGHIPVQIWRRPGGFALACFRSYADGLYHALARAGGLKED